MATEAYPVIEAIKTKAESPDTALPPAAPINAITIVFGAQKAAVDISAALTVEDVRHTLLTVFHLGSNARIIVKRADDGAVVVPGPKLQPGEYVLEEVDGHVKKAYKSIVEKHLPNVQQQIAEKHLPFLVESTKAGASKLKDAAAVAKQRTGDGLSAAGAHFSVVKENVGTGLATAATHFGKARDVATAKTSEAISVAGEHVKGQAQRAAVIVNTHAVSKPETWTAKLWIYIVSCAGGPLSALTGLRIDEFARLQPEASAALTAASSSVTDAVGDVTDKVSSVTDKLPESVTSIASEVPLSKAAENFLK